MEESEKTTAAELKSIKRIHWKAGKKKSTLYPKTKEMQE